MIIELYQILKSFYFFNQEQNQTTSQNALLGIVTVSKSARYISMHTILKLTSVFSISFNDGIRNKNTAVLHLAKGAEAKRTKINK